MRILVLNAHHEDVYFDATNEEEAYLAIFNYLDDTYDCYWEYVDARPSYMDYEKWQRNKATIAKAREGDANAAKRIVTARSEYDDEGFWFSEVIDPKEWIDKNAVH